MATYDIGDKIRLSVTFTDSASTPTDPTEVTLKYLAPGGSVQTLVYNGGAGDVAKDDTGDYHYDLDTTTFDNGELAYKFYGTGTLIAAVNGSFTLRHDVFDGV